MKMYVTLHEQSDRDKPSRRRPRKSKARILETPEAITDRKQQDHLVVKFRTLILGR